VFKDVPWYWGHGMSDPIFPFDLGKWSYLQLKQLGINIQWGWYAGHQHVYFEEMLVDSMRFLAEVKGRTKFLPAALNWLNVKVGCPRRLAFDAPAPYPHSSSNGFPSCSFVGARWSQPVRKTLSLAKRGHPASRTAVARP
jgi:hypothetical protein